MAIRFYMPDLSPQFAALDREVVKAGLLAGVEESWRQHLRVEDVRVKVVIDPRRTLPEWGVGGEVVNYRDLVVWFDPSKLFEPQFPARVSKIIAHELNHVARLESVGFIRNLSDALGFEGFALVGEEVGGHPQSFYARLSKDAALRRLATQALPHFGNSRYNHAAWFFGRPGDEQFPRHGGYALGRAIVSGYLAAKNLNPSEAIGIPALKIIDALKAGEFDLDTRPATAPCRHRKLSWSRLPKCEWL